jgi:hypothetical protein
VNGLERLLDREARRTSRTGRPFTVLRIGPPALTSPERLERLRIVIEVELRKTDLVHEASGEVVAMLIDTAEHHAPAVVERLDAAFRKARLGFEPRIAWASVGPMHEPCWERAWRMAGALLVANTAAA